jgi:hypothetical protein
LPETREHPPHDAVTFIRHQTTENSLQMGCICPPWADFSRFWPDFTPSQQPNSQPWAPVTAPLGKTSRIPP